MSNLATAATKLYISVLWRVRLGSSLLTCDLVVGYPGIFLMMIRHLPMTWAIHKREVALG
jgi:hypothetical protein